MAKQTRSVVALLLALLAVLAVEFPASATAHAAVRSRSVSPSIPHDYNGPILNGYLTYDGVTLTATASTVAWNRGTINLEADLYVGSTLAWEGRNTCYNSTSCGLPSVYKVCPAHGHTWQLYSYAWGPGTAGVSYVSDFDQVIS